MQGAQPPSSAEDALFLGLLLGVDDKEPQAAAGHLPGRVCADCWACLCYISDYTPLL